MFLAPATQFPNNKIYNFLIRVCTTLVKLALLKGQRLFSVFMSISYWPWQPAPSWLTFLPFKSIESTEIDFVTFKGSFEHIISCTRPENGESSWAYLSVSKVLGVTYTHLKNSLCLQMEQEMLMRVGRAQAQWQKAAAALI